MKPRRILSLWFPRLGAERILRDLRGEVALDHTPFAVIDTHGSAETLSALSVGASAAGLQTGMSLRDACAICPDLLTRRRNSAAEAQFLASLNRWATRFSPWVTNDGEDGLLLDVTGCAHLFGGEAALISEMTNRGADMGLTMRAGLADTRGAAWALARYAGQTGQSDRSGDAIDMEAPATRSRAAKRRHWERGGAAPAILAQQMHAGDIAPVGQTRRALGALPVAALRLDAQTAATLARLGLRRIEDLMGQPRTALARRFGQGLVLRMDQALGTTPEPVTPDRPYDGFALRLTLPDPIGLLEDVTAAVDRLLPPLCEKLATKGMAARCLLLEAYRADHTMQRLEVRLARASNAPEKLRGLLTMRLDDVDAGFGIDMIRLIATVVESIQTRAPVGHNGAGKHVAQRGADQSAIDDLIGRIGARAGLEAVTRRHPSTSHLPEKSALTLVAAFSDPAPDWQQPVRPRPLRLWNPEPVDTDAQAMPPATFRWRRRNIAVAEARGPERISPEWWLDSPAWRSGQRDYWDIITQDGERLWLFFAHGGTMSAGWFCHGSFS